MTTVNIIPTSEINKLSTSHRQGIQKFSIGSHHLRFYLRFESPQRGGQGLGKLSRVRELFVKDGCLYLGFRIPNGEAGDTERYVRLESMEDVAAI
jgi:hypothetical protein